jgi:hypothetical protein
LFLRDFTGVKDIERQFEQGHGPEMIRLISDQGTPALSHWKQRENNSVPGGRVSQDETKGRKNMPLIQVLLALIVVGVLLWLVNRFIPMQGTIKSILNGVVVIAVVLWLLNIFGLFHSLAHIHVGT